MGQKPSQLTAANGGKQNQSVLLQWMSRNAKPPSNLTMAEQQPIRFQYKTKRKQPPTTTIGDRKGEKKSFSGDNNNDYRPNKQQVNSKVLLVCDGSTKRDQLNNNISNNGDNLNVSNREEMVECKANKSDNALNTYVTNDKNNYDSCKPLRTKSEPNLVTIGGAQKRDCQRSRRHRKSARLMRCNNRKQQQQHNDHRVDGVYTNAMQQQFGYEIRNIDDFLNKATIDKPANIPVVLASPTVLYRTRIGGYQEEIDLPLGMVVNAVFKNQNWLYVQTPHAEEGYVGYASCLPLGIIPPTDDTSSNCWEITTDLYPKPSGNMTDTEKLSTTGSDRASSRCRQQQQQQQRLRRRRRSKKVDRAVDTHSPSLPLCDETSVDRLYLRATAAAAATLSHSPTSAASSTLSSTVRFARRSAASRETFLAITRDYKSSCDNTIDVNRGDVVALMSAHLYGWFWVRNEDGAEGFIPSIVAKHCFL